MMATLQVMDDVDICDLLCLDVPKAQAARKALPSKDALEEFSRTAKALGDPTRLAIAAALLAGGECCVCDLGWITARDEKTVSHHVRLLKQAGLAVSRRDGRMVMYALTPAGRSVVTSLLAARVTA